jgi:hypothetical protein
MGRSVPSAAVIVQFPYLFFLQILSTGWVVQGRVAMPPVPPLSFNSHTIFSSDPEHWMGSSGMGRSVPIAALIEGIAINEKGEEVNIVEEIDYQEFFEVKHQ